MQLTIVITLLNALLQANLFVHSKGNKRLFHACMQCNNTLDIIACRHNTLEQALILKVVITNSSMPYFFTK